MTVHIAAAQYMRTKEPSHSLCGKQNMPTSPLQFFSVEAHVDADCPECLKHLERFAAREAALLLCIDPKSEQKRVDDYVASGGTLPRT